MKAIVVHRNDLNNVGDIASNPLQYFLKPDEYKTVDITDISRLSFDESIPVIAGGGGLLANSFMDDALRDLTVSNDKNEMFALANSFWKSSHTSNKLVRDEFFQKLNSLIKEYGDKLSTEHSPRIVWGAGHNGNFEKKFKGVLEYPAWLRDFDEVGVRDWAQEYTWAPCASCMHPALREKHVIKHPVIWFEHKKQLIKSTEFGNNPIPRFINSGNNIEETIRILGSADVIVTNSYHGAYWGLLLGRKVIVVEAWSSKFNAMKHQPVFLAKGESWKDYVDQCNVYNHALEESINATEKFWNKVKERL